MMDLVELEALIQQGESEVLEFKKSTSLLHAIGETLCGFLNQKGGRVLIGITSTKKIVGQNISDSTLQEIAAMIAKFEPPAVIDMKRLLVKDQNEVMVLTALPTRIDAPYTWEGRAYQRIGSTTSRMPQQIYQRMLLDREHSNHRWETGLVSDYSLSDLDSEEILRTIRLGVKTGRLPEYEENSLITLLGRLGLEKNKHFLNAAVVLFGKKFLPDFPQCQLRLARFKGLDKSEFIDQKQHIGNAFYLLEEAMLFLRRHLPVTGKILPYALDRQDIPLFPFEALREAVVNAFCHRSYSHPGGAVSIAIFDNRLEIWSDGGLPFGLTPDDLKKNHMSHQRNPLIATIFYNRGLIEKWGRGTEKIISLCVDAGHPEPEFIEQANSFLIRFLIHEDVKSNSNLSERQRMILDILSNSINKSLTFIEIKSHFPNPPADRTLRDDFQYLKRLGHIRPLGRGKGTKWVLV